MQVSLPAKALDRPRNMLMATHDTQFAPSIASPAASAQERLLLRTAWVALGLCIAVCAAMLISWARTSAQGPVISPELTALKEQLLLRPKDEPVKERVRALDLELRQRYFRQLRLNGAGAWLV